MIHLYSVYSVNHFYTGCLKKKGEAVQSDFSYSICEAMIKVRYVLNSSFNGEHFKRLNFSIWSILTPSTAKIPRAIGNEDLHQKRHDIDMACTVSIQMILQYILNNFYCFES